LGALAICRLAKVSPEYIMKVGSSLLSMYRLIGAIVLVVTTLASILLVRRFHKAMVSFTSAHLGTLLLLSGFSYFAQRVGAAEAPFSLLDDMARIIAEVRHGRCHIWEDIEEMATNATKSVLKVPITKESAAQNAALVKCDCGEECRTEIIAWLVSSWFVVIVHVVRRRMAKMKGPLPTDEEKMSLTSLRGDGPTPQRFGKSTSS